MQLAAKMFCFLGILVTILSVSSSQKVDKVIVQPTISGNVWRSAQLLELLPAQTVVVEWTPVPPEVTFVIVQAHSQFARLMLKSSAQELYSSDFVNGTNAALAITDLSFGAVAYITTPLTTGNITVLVVVVGYMKGAPLPGGCNMEFEPEVAPFIRLSYDRVQTTAEFQRASLALQTLSSASTPMGAVLSNLPKCDIAFTILQYDVYFMVIQDGTAGSKEYFRAVDTMSDVVSIRANAIKATSAWTAHPVTRMQFSSFPGVGVVYNVIVTDPRDGVNTVAAYAPAVTYACQLDSDDCDFVVHSFGWLFCVTCAIIGTLLCLAGHRYFIFEMFIFGFLAASLITFILVARFTDLDYSGRTSFTMVIGVVGGGVWSSVWWFFGSPVISALLPGLVLGFLVSCIVFFTPFYDLPVFQDDLSFWMAFSCFVLIPSVIFVAYPKMLSIMSCAFVGTYGAVVAVDRYLGSGMTAIVLNVIKRAVIPEVSKMTPVISFQKTEVILTVFWALATILGIIIQLILIRNRPPFPTSAYLTRRRYVQISESRSQPTERTPLLAA